MWSQWSQVVLLVQAARVCQGQVLESMSTMELLAVNGAPGESHDVTTKDGYIINIFRLQRRGGGMKHPVVLQHGLSQNSNCWFRKGPNIDLVFRLWRKGYDVWLGNSRGTTYGKRHVKKTPRDPSFWRFSFHEMGYYDMPAVIDYILNKTGHPDLYYVGHSMGTTMFYIMGATRPEYNKKIRTMFSLAPVAFFSDSPTWLKLLSTFRDTFFGLLRTARIYELIPFMKSLNWLNAGVCSADWPTRNLCRDFLKLGIGNTRGLTDGDIAMILSHLDTYSANVVLHYAQLIASGEFCWFDYGARQNLKLYGSRRPPKYKLSLVTAPVVLYYSDSDPLSRMKDVNHLAALLPNATMFLFKGYNHVSYLWAKNVSFLNNKLIKVIEDTS